MTNSCVKLVVLVIAAIAASFFMGVDDANGQLFRRGGFFRRPLANPHSFQYTGPRGCVIYYDWTWPGVTEESLRKHLQGWPHYQFDTMTMEEMLRFHDEHHNEIGPISGDDLRRNRNKIP